MGKVDNDGPLSLLGSQAPLATAGLRGPLRHWVAVLSDQTLGESLDQKQEKNAVFESDFLLSTVIA
jgi:hypothetical protein